MTTRIAMANETVERLIFLTRDRVSQYSRSYVLRTPAERDHADGELHYYTSVLAFLEGHQSIRQQIAEAGDRRDWDECNRLESEAGRQTPKEPDTPKLTFAISEIRGGEDFDGSLESTDLYLRVGSLALLCNVPAGQTFTYSLISDDRDESGTVGIPVALPTVTAEAAQDTWQAQAESCDADYKRLHALTHSWAERAFHLESEVRGLQRAISEIVGRWTYLHEQDEKAIAALQDLYDKAVVDANATALRASDLEVGQSEAKREAAALKQENEVHTEKLGHLLGCLQELFGVEYVGDDPDDACYIAEERIQTTLKRALAAEKACHKAWAELKREKAWADTVAKSKAPCGHWSSYSVSEDGGKHITCLKCDSITAAATREQAIFDAIVIWKDRTVSTEARLTATQAEVEMLSRKRNIQEQAIENRRNEARQAVIRAEQAEKVTAELLRALKAIVDAWGVGDGGRHVGQFIDEAIATLENAEAAR